MSQDPATRFRELLDAERILLAAGAFDALAARLVERAGFEALYVTGGGTALAMHGLPDLELVSMTEAADTAAVLARSVRVPVMADADTGYGGPLNVRRTVQTFERAGVAALHIEDQSSPKKCGQLAGKHLVTRDEMVHKIRAAVDARRHPDLVLVARTDALAVEGMASTLDRCRAYVDAGADAVFVEAPRNPAEVAAVADALASRTRLVFGQSASGVTPFMSAAELESMGFAMMLFPNFATLAAIRAITSVLESIRTTGSAARAREACASLAEMHDLAGETEMERLLESYASGGGA